MIRAFLLSLLASLLVPEVLGESFPPPKWLGNTNDHGRGIQRTMTLLATSTPEQRNTVRILFYGQSITEQNLEYCMKVFKRALPADFKVRWKAVLHGADEFVSPGLADPTVETTVTLAQGLKNTRHTLEIMGDETTPIAALRVFRPPLKVQ
jgi:hypothetical protein